MIKGIQKIYTEISASYELTNILLTLGLDSGWRKKAANLALNSNPDAQIFLDICSGTGQTASILCHGIQSRENARVIAADFSYPMLKQAKLRSHNENLSNIRFTLGDVVNLPFQDNTFDVITITFATRNLAAAPNHLLESFQEFYRVLKPGGVFYNLETSQPSLGLIKFFFHLYVKITVVPLGWKLTGSKGSYRYLSSSIINFLPAKELAETLQKVGFTGVTWKKMLFGAVALHQGQKKS